MDPKSLQSCFSLSEVEAVLTQALSQKPKGRKLAYRLASILEAQGKVDEAQYKKILQQDPEDEAAK